jgi:4-amino-4-deoxy-L-arabinose transferase-like glycosyltransferase
MAAVSYYTLSTEFTHRMSRLIPAAILAVILLYAGLLRIDALFRSYGPYQHPRWLAAMQPAVRTAAPLLTPNWPWRHIPQPYVGGDPINYLRFGRQMRNFYAAHVREPGFPAATRLGLMLAGDEDVGISVASISFSLLLLVATYLLGRQLGSPAVGLAAAAALAIDRSAVYWAIGGWRDEMFTFFAIMSAWAFLRLDRQPTYERAAIAGIVGGGALLTRITSITLLAPAVVFLLVSRRSGQRPLREVALATGIMLALVAPFLINCAIATGDPLLSINHHTDFFLKREGIADPPPKSAVAYVSEKFVRPLAAADTIVNGIFAYPFNNKWVGLDLWLSGLGQVLSWLAIGGMTGWIWRRDGRLLLCLLLGGLIPFSATWTVRGGSEWRFTLFAYSFYLVAAFWCVEQIIFLARHRFRALASRKAILPAAAVILLTIAAVCWTFLMPYAVARESLVRGDAAMIRANVRDRFLFADGWSNLVVTGNVTARFSTKPAATIRLPLPESRPYKLLLRIDPLHYPEAPLQRVHVSLNGRSIAALDLSSNPERVGEYPLVLPRDAVRRGSNELILRSERMVPIGKAGTEFPEIPRDREVGLRLWYMLVVPS